MGWSTRSVDEPAFPTGRSTAPVLLLAEAWLAILRARIDLRRTPGLVITEREPFPLPGRAIHQPLSEKVCAAVERASRLFLPRATCLERAVAARRLFTRQGAPIEIRIGVRRGLDGVEAHAWLLQVQLSGAEEIEGFEVLEAASKEVDQ